MHVINGALRPLFDAILRPFAAHSPMWTLVPISAVFAVIALLVFKRFSNQTKMDAVKRKIHAGFFEIRLFNDDLRAIIRAQGDILRHNLHYLGLTLVPIVILLPFVSLMVAQLQFHYGYEGLQPGESTLVKVILHDNVANASMDKPAAQLEAPQGLQVETPAVWIPSSRELAWRLRANAPGAYELKLNLDGQQFTKSVTVSNQVVRRSPYRPDGSIWDQFVYPAEPPLPAGGPVQAIEVGYPEASVNLFGWHTHWTIAFLVLAIAIALVLRKPLGVTI